MACLLSGCCGSAAHALCVQVDSLGFALKLVAFEVDLVILGKKLLVLKPHVKLHLLWI
jgi:hypothetical protein